MLILILTVSALTLIFLTMNDKNLKPINERADFIELSRKGGRNSGISRRKKAEWRKEFNLLTEIMLADLTVSKARANRGKSRNEKAQGKHEQSPEKHKKQRGRNLTFSELFP